MINTSFAALTLLASAALPSVGTHMHLHPRVAPDTRVNITLFNTSSTFRDVMIAGQSYEIGTHHVLNIKAPAGTTILADSRTPRFRRGDQIATLTPEMNQTTLKLE